MRVIIKKGNCGDPEGLFKTDKSTSLVLEEEIKTPDDFAGQGGTRW
jgi:hypothetical protein